MPANTRERRVASHTAMIVCDSPEFHEEIEHGLVQVGYKAVTADADSVDFEQALKKFKPSVVIVSLSDPDPEALANLREFSSQLKYSTIWYGEPGELALDGAEALGAHGILFPPCDTDELATVLGLSASHAETMWELQNEIAKLQDDLETRKFVDRARGIVMQQMGLTEEEAYHLLRRESRRQRKPMKEVSQAVIMAQGFLAGGKGSLGMSREDRDDEPQEGDAES